MIKLPSMAPEPMYQRSQNERVQAQVAAAAIGGDAEGARAEARRVAASPLVPDMAALSAGREHPVHKDPSFDVSAQSLGELLARISMSGASVAARTVDGSRRVQITSLGPGADPAGDPLVAHLRVTDGRYRVAEVASRRPSEELPAEEVQKDVVVAEQPPGSLVDVVG